MSSSQGTRDVGTQTTSPINDDEIIVISSDEEDNASSDDVKEIMKCFVCYKVVADYAFEECHHQIICCACLLFWMSWGVPRCLLCREPRWPTKTVTPVEPTVIKDKS